MVSVILILLIYNVVSFYGPSFILKDKKIQKIEGTDPQSGKPMSLSLDKKKTVINFWATWCSSCVDEIPVLKKISNEVNMVGVMRGPVDGELFASLKIPYMNIIAEEALLEEFMINVIPTTLLVIDNKVVKVKTGAFSIEELKSWISD